MPGLTKFSVVSFLCVLAFALLVLNFVAPALNFMFSDQAQIDGGLSYVSRFLSILPFIITAMFFVLVFKLISTVKGRRVIFLSVLEAVSALAIFVVWFLRTYSGLLNQLEFPLDFLVDFSPIVFVVVLYVGWLLVIAPLARSVLDLRSRFETLYLSVNLMFAVSISAHLFKGVDFLYYFGFRLPVSLSWIFAYTPTLLVSFMSLFTWATLILSTSCQRRFVLHLALVVLPVVLVLIAVVIRPLFGYVLTSTIVWGSSYELFYPAAESLTLVLFATTAFVSSSVLLGPLSWDRNSRLIRLSVLSVVLAGMSFTPTSTVGVALSLVFLFLAMRVKGE